VVALGKWIAARKDAEKTETGKMVDLAEENPPKAH
jgi:hypothetical protein